MNRSQRQKRSQEPPQQFRNRLAMLRLMLVDEPARAGDQAIKLLEEYLEALAHTHGYRGEGSLGRYAVFLRGRDTLSDELLERADGYTQVRNCLAHTYGIQVGPQLASELVEFLELLLKTDAVTVSDLMTRDVHSVAASERLDRARDLMVRGGYSRLPVLDASNEIVGLLTERDIVITLADADTAKTRIDTLSVDDAFSKDARERVIFLPPDAPQQSAIDALRETGVVAVLVTASGTPANRPMGIVTHADLLYRM